MVPRCEEAFKKAKDSLSSSNVLVHYDPSLPVILESDASQYGMGAVIFHRFPSGDERPIAYATRSLNLPEKNYSQIEKEGFAIIFGVTKFYLYLFGNKFTLRTDHKPLLKIFAPDSATPVLAAARLQHAEKKNAKNQPQNVSKVCLKICVECYKYLLNYRR